MSIHLDFEKGTAKMSVADLVEKLKEAGVEAMDEFADEMVLMAKAYCPVDTGSLQQSIRKERAENGVSVRAGGYVVNPRSRRIVNYAAVVEARTGFMQQAYEFAVRELAERVKTRMVERCQP
jgi:hypothetical protein